MSAGHGAAGASSGGGRLLAAALAAAGLVACSTSSTTATPTVVVEGAAVPAPAARPAGDGPAARDAAAAPACRPPARGDRDLYVRGDFNSWGLDEGARFVYACDHYELVGRFGGAHRFKIADENWAPDADFGAASAAATSPKPGQPTPLAAGGDHLAYDFGPATRLSLAFPAGDAAPPVLTVSDCPAPPSPVRRLFLRGAMTAGAAGDAFRFRWHCDAYYLNVRAASSQSFRIADEAGGPASTFGLAPGTTLVPGRPHPLVDVRAAPDATDLRVDFAGEHTLRLAFDGAGGAPTLVVGPKTFADPSVPPLTDPVARSVRFDSRDTAFKAPFGAVAAHTPVGYAFDALPGVSKATLVVERRRLEGNQEVLAYTTLARVPMTAATHGDRERWSATQRFDAPGVYGWWFELEIGGRTYAYGNNDDTLHWTREKGTGGVGALVERPASAARIRRYRQTVFDPSFHVPDWAQDAVYYYIFPERFRNGDRRNDPRPGRDRYQDHPVEFHADWNDRPWKPGTGDGSDAVYNNDFFGGDIAGIVEKLDDIRALGANTLYITPLFAAASNHKYDTADYRHVDPRFGTDADFARLCREAAHRGLRVLPDTSLNHVGADSLYFDRYAHYTAGGNVGAFQGGRIHPESPYASWFRLDPTQADPSKQYAGWVGVADLPEIDKSSPAFRRFAYGDPDSVTRLWLRRGAAGWRMDVAPWVPDDFWRQWRTVVRQENPEALTVAEAWFDASKFLVGDMFDSTMNYIFRNALIDYANGGSGGALVAQLEHLREAYPPAAFHALMNLLSTHDVPRTLHLLGDVDGQSTPEQVALAKRKFRLALLFQMTYPGAPAVYYGDEVGVTGGEDPFNRGTYPWPDRGGHPDLALKADVTRLLALRRAHPVLRRGTLLAPLQADAHVVVLPRQLGATWALTATNNDATARRMTVTLPDGAPASGWRDLLGGRATLDGRQLSMELPAYGGAVLVSR